MSKPPQSFMLGFVIPYLLQVQIVEGLHGLTIKTSCFVTKYWALGNNSQKRVKNMSRYNDLFSCWLLPSYPNHLRSDSMCWSYTREGYNFFPVFNLWYKHLHPFSFISFALSFFYHDFVVTSIWNLLHMFMMM